MTNFDAWIKAAKPTRSVSCKTCAGDADLLGYIERFHRMKCDGKVSLSWRQFYDEFLVPAGYEMTISGLLNHVRNCLGGARGER